MSAFEHKAGEELEVLSLSLTLRKDIVEDDEGEKKGWCGFKIGGGIDQDISTCPYGYKDNGIYVTHVTDDSPAERAGLQQHDKLLQVNGHDFTMLCHKKAVEYVKKYPILHLLVARRGVSDRPPPPNTFST